MAVKNRLLTLYCYRMLAQEVNQWLSRIVS